MVFFLLVIITLYVLIELLERSVRRNRINDREPISINTLYEQYYQSSGLDKQIVEVVVLAISDAIKVNSKLIRPSDVLEREYRQLIDFADTITDYIFLHVQDAIEDYYGYAVTLDSDWSTVDDVIKSVAKQLATLPRK